jgi:hypothetical protein
VQLQVFDSAGDRGYRTHERISAEAEADDLTADAFLCAMNVRVTKVARSKSSSVAVVARILR